MKKYLSIIVIVLIFTNCNSVEPDNSYISKLSTISIQKVEIIDYSVTLSIIVQTPTPCWDYYKTEKNQDVNSAYLTIFGKDEGEMCIQVLDSFEMSETLDFKTKGEKVIKFWVSESESLDTTITIN